MTTKQSSSAIPYTFSIQGASDLVIYARPEDLQYTYKKRLNRYRTRGGWIEEDWGDELDVISGSGFTDSFVLPDVGVVRFCAEQTEAYTRFKELVEFYRSNGFIYDAKGNVIEAVDDQLNMQKEQVVLHYRETSHFGYFNSFNWTENAEKPFQFQWSFEYVVVLTIHGY